MKLAHSLAIYGLVETVLLPDYVDYREIHDDARRDERIEHVVSGILNQVQLRPVLFAYHDLGEYVRNGIKFTYNHSSTAYNWEQTNIVRRDYGWMCGLLEAMTRRWLTDFYNDFPASVRTHLPIALSGWPLS